MQTGPQGSREYKTGLFLTVKLIIIMIIGSFFPLINKKFNSLP